VLFAAVTLSIAMLLVDIGLRVAMEPSERSSGKLFGYEMPPLRLPMHHAPKQVSDRDQQHRQLVVDGASISIGDLWGYQRPDPVTGYAVQESRRSTNGWWQSNALGARERGETPREIPAGTRRILVFGDSFAQASRVPQEEAWSNLLESESADLDVVNFGVDGYGMGQSYLRFQQLSTELEQDLVWLVWVPVKDLWRDINVVRSLAKNWDYDVVLPRFVAADGGVVLVRSPFLPGGEIEPTELRDHLHRYDRFFDEREFAPAGPIGRTMIGKLALRAAIQLRKRSLYSRVDPSSEAVEVTRGIVQLMRDQVEDLGGQFTLVVLPSHRDLDLLRKRGSREAQWRMGVDSVCAEVACIDLSSPMQALDRALLDRGYDGTHYGPLANAQIARLLGEAISSEPSTRTAVSPGEDRNSTELPASAPGP